MVKRHHLYTYIYIYSVYSWMFCWGYQSYWNLGSTVRPFHPFGVEGRVTKFASQIARQSALLGDGIGRTHGWDVTDQNGSLIMEWIGSVNSFFFLGSILLGVKVAASLLFLSYRFQNMYTSHFTHWAFVLYWAFCCYCDVIRVWYRCFCYSFSQHSIWSQLLTQQLKIQKDDFRWSWQTYQFVCYINHRFLFLYSNQRRLSFLVLKQTWGLPGRYQDRGAGTWTSKSQLRNRGEGQAVDSVAFVSMIETGRRLLNWNIGTSFLFVFFWRM